MTELVTRSQADAFFLGLLVLGLIVAVAVGLQASRRSPGGGDALAAAVKRGGPPFLIGALWHVYNAVTDRVGLDTVLNLALNAALFLAVGVGCGLVWAWLSGREKRAVPEPETADAGEERGAP